MSEKISQIAEKLEELLEAVCESEKGGKIVGELDGKTDCYIKITFGKTVEDSLECHIDRTCSDAQLLMGIMCLMTKVSPMMVHVAQTALVEKAKATHEKMKDLEKGDDKCSD